jgi:hypothetical protein
VARQISVLHSSPVALLPSLIASGGHGLSPTDSLNVLDRDFVMALPIAATARQVTVDRISAAA